MRRSALKEFVGKSERPETPGGRLRALVEVPDNQLVILQDPELMRKVDAAFFRVAEARGGAMVRYQLEEQRLPSRGRYAPSLGGPGLRSNAWRARNICAS